MPRDAADVFFYSALDVKDSLGHLSTICTRLRTVQSMLARQSVLFLLTDAAL